MTVQNSSFLERHSSHVENSCREAPDLGNSLLRHILLWTTYMLIEHHRGFSLEPIECPPIVHITTLCLQLLLNKVLRLSTKYEAI